MSSNSLKKLLCTTATAAVLIGTMIPARADIKVAVAANFADTVGALLAEWAALESSNFYTGIYTSGATATLFAQIVTSGSDYDIFFAANTASAYALYNKYPAHVVPNNPPFNYAEGGLVLWSGPAKQINVTSGLPYPVTTDLLIATPSSAPYGLAALQLLNDSPWTLGLISTTTATTPPLWPQGHVFTGGNIGSTYDNLLNNTSNKDYGFVAKSQVALAVTTAPYTASWNTYTTGAVYAYEYYAEGGGSSDASYPASTSTSWTSDAAGSHPFDHIIQAAVRVKGSAPDAEIESFISFVQGYTHPGVALRIIKHYGYRWAIGQ